MPKDDIDINSIEIDTVQVLEDGKIAITIPEKVIPATVVTITREQVQREMDMLSGTRAALSGEIDVLRSQLNEKEEQLSSLNADIQKRQDLLNQK